ncbi:mediator complex subunit [Mycoemilia scoparia]|uniref:Mediator of RNA polymerase II transcription subunit 14 n=1 Tax=Mycoemilia scoparia TaxID=417184 RepID=A0A9W8DSI4_9FUNG|nr:mediator complex subunit [Mycoemilia scoparia]
MNGKNTYQIENGIPVEPGVGRGDSGEAQPHSIINGKRKIDSIGTGHPGNTMRKRDRRENDDASPKKHSSESFMFAGDSERNRSLALIIKSIVALSTTKLNSVVEGSSTQTDAQKRRSIIEYTLHMRKYFTNLLSVVRWAANAGKIQKYQDVATQVHNHNGLFTRTVDALYAIYFAMPQARMRSYDIQTAIDVLSTGSYQRLPLIIKEKYTIPPKLTQEQISVSKNIINSIICKRMLCGELLPPQMSNFVVNDGRIAFSVPDEFDVSLTLLQFSESIPWHVLSLRIAVDSSKNVPESMHVHLTQHQVGVLIKQSQDILIHSARAQNIEELGVSSNSKPPEQPQTLSRLYDFLHTQCLTIAIEMMCAQAFMLSKGKWANNMYISISKVRDCLTLHYWVSPKAIATYPSLSFDDAESVSGVKSITTYQSANTRSQNTQTTLRPASSQQSRFNRDLKNYIKIKLAPTPTPTYTHSPAQSVSSDDSHDGIDPVESNERAQMKMSSKIDICIEWNRTSGLGSSSRWNSTDPDAQHNNSDTLSISLSQLDIDGLLTHATTVHGQMVISELRNTIVSSGLFDPLDINTIHNDASDVNASIPFLRVWYRPGKSAVDIAIDPLSGLLGASIPPLSSGSDTHSDVNTEVLDTLTASLNKTPWKVPGLILELRYIVALADLDKLAEEVGGICPLKSPTPRPKSLYQTQTPGTAMTQQTTSLRHSGWLPISSSDKEYLTSTIAGLPPSSKKLRFYILEGTGMGDNDATTTVSSISNKNMVRGVSKKNSWYIMVSMVNQMQFWLVQLRSKANDPIIHDIVQISPLSTDNIFTNISIKYATLDPLSKTMPVVDVARSMTASMLSGKSGIRMEYIKTLVNMCHTRLAFHRLQGQLSSLRIPYALRQPREADPRANFQSEQAVPQTELEGHVPSIFISVKDLINMSPVNWSVLNKGILSSEARYMASIRIGMQQAKDQHKKNKARFAVTVLCPISVDNLPEQVLKKVRQVQVRHTRRGSSRSHIPHENVVAIKYTYSTIQTCILRFIHDWSKLHMLFHISRQVCILESSLSTLNLSGLRVESFEFMAQDAAIDPRLTVVISDRCRLTISTSIENKSISTASSRTQVALFAVLLEGYRGPGSEPMKLFESHPHCRENKIPLQDSPIVRWLHFLVQRLNINGDIGKFLYSLKSQINLIHIINSLHDNMSLTSDIRTREISEVISPHNPVCLTNYGKAFSDLPQLPITMVQNPNSTRIIIRNKFSLSIYIVAPDMFYITDTCAPPNPPRSISSNFFGDSMGPIPQFSKLIMALSSKIRLLWPLQWQQQSNTTATSQAGQNRATPLRAPILPLSHSGVICHTLYLPTILSAVVRWTYEEKYSIEGLKLLVDVSPTSLEEPSGTSLYEQQQQPPVRPPTTTTNTTTTTVTVAAPIKEEAPKS